MTALYDAFILASSGSRIVNWEVILELLIITHSALTHHHHRLSTHCIYMQAEAHAAAGAVDGLISLEQYGGT